MTRTEALADDASVEPRLADERLRSLAEIAHDWVDDTAHPVEDHAVRADIAEGIARRGLGEFTTFTEIGDASTRFRG